MTRFWNSTSSFRPTPCPNLTHSSVLAACSRRREQSAQGLRRLAASRRSLLAAGAVSLRYRRPSIHRLRRFMGPMILSHRHRRREEVRAQSTWDRALGADGRGQIAGWSRPSFPRSTRSVRVVGYRGDDKTCSWQRCDRPEQGVNGGALSRSCGCFAGSGWLSRHDLACSPGVARRDETLLPIQRCVGRCRPVQTSTLTRSRRFCQAVAGMGARAA